MNDKKRYETNGMPDRCRCGTRLSFSYTVDRKDDGSRGSTKVSIRCPKITSLSLDHDEYHWLETDSPISTPSIILFNIRG